MSKPNPSAPPQSKLSDVALDTSDIVLSTLRDAASLAPVPFLQEAAALALGIVNIIQGAKSNKEAFTRLANDACGLVYAVLCTLSRSDALADNHSSPLESNLRALKEELVSIEAFASKEISRSWPIRMIKYKSDFGTIQQYRESLRQSLDMFGLKSTISIQENIERMAAQQEAFLKELEERRVHLDAEEAERKRLDKEAAEEEERIKKEQAEREREREKVEQERAEREARERSRREMEQKLESERIALAERERANAELLAARSREDQERQAIEAEKHRIPGMPPTSDSNPFRQSQGSFNFPNLQNANGKFKVMHIGGDHIVSDNSVSNTNSGNTTTSTVSNSNNDSSVRIGPGRTRGKRR